MRGRRTLVENVMQQWGHRVSSEVTPTALADNLRGKAGARTAAVVVGIGLAPAPPP